MIRILLFLKLKKITQRAFAEYHSKRNFVERVHAAENEVLSRHGPFSSKQKYPNATVGTSAHRENIEEMAEDGTVCLKQARFDGHSLTSVRRESSKVFETKKGRGSFFLY